MSFGATTPPTPPTVLEGDYSAWTQKWVVDCDIGTHLDCAGVGFNIVNDRILVRGSTCGYIFKLSTGESITGRMTDLYLGYEEKAACQFYSILGKYAVWMAYEVGVGATKVNVYKDGMLQETITISGASISGVAISPDGKYILIYDREPNHKLYCYEGSSPTILSKTYKAESPHPYPNNYDHTWTITQTGAQRIRVHFTKLVIEAVYDHLYLKDGADNIIVDYTGYDATGIWSHWVSGDTVKLQLTSDETETRYGFHIDKIEYR